MENSLSHSVSLLMTMLYFQIMFYVTILDSALCLTDMQGLPNCLRHFLLENCPKTFNRLFSGKQRQELS